jgi:hypothetical protein
MKRIGKPAVHSPTFCLPSAGIPAAAGVEPTTPNSANQLRFTHIAGKLEDLPLAFSPRPEPEDAFFAG